MNSSENPQVQNSPGLPSTLNQDRFWKEKGEGTVVFLNGRNKHTISPTIAFGAPNQDVVLDREAREMIAEKREPNPEQPEEFKSDDRPKTILSNKRKEQEAAWAKLGHSLQKMVTDRTRHERMTPAEMAYYGLGIPSGGDTPSVYPKKFHSFFQFEKESLQAKKLKGLDPGSREDREKIKALGMSLYRYKKEIRGRELYEYPVSFNETFTMFGNPGKFRVIFSVYKNKAGEVIGVPEGLAMHTNNSIGGYKLVI